ncbi:MAG: helix-hairpin-helix domain-containing protein [Desulfobulbaceae bacterium]|nr:helix-hairpin-helix domain-containing protein [Desulfobulbaceae bacterium]
MRRTAQMDAAPPKDKRTLVLFLLGTLLLFSHLIPVSRETAGPSYGVVHGKNTEQWRVASLPFTLDMHEDANSRVLPLVPEQGTVNELPAQLSLFVNRPLPINRASKEDLEMLPGIGPHLAASIMKVLQQQGRFNGPNDLRKVSGIGPKNMQRFAPLISFE